MPPGVFKALEPHFETVRAESGAVLQTEGTSVNFAYFPCGASLASFEVLLRDGAAIETAMIGREGAAGGIVSHGYLPAYARATVRHPGKFLKVEVAELEKFKARFPAMRQLFASYSDCLIAQLLQCVACNAAHSAEQRAAKWLLAALDRTGADDVPMTQEQLASIIGVGRSYLSRLLQQLKAEGILETRRGGVRVLDAARLRQLSCDCNDAVRFHFDTVLAGIYPSTSDE